MARGTAITVVDRMRIMTTARDTIDAATTTIGKEEPGAIRAFSCLVAPAPSADSRGLGGVGSKGLPQAEGSSDKQGRQQWLKTGLRRPGKPTAFVPAGR